MRSLLTICVLLSTSLIAQAQTKMSCKVEAYVTSEKGNLVPANEDLLVPVEIVNRKEAAKCTYVKYLGHDISVCARQSNILGGYETKLLIRDLDATSYVVSSFGTSADQEKNKLVQLERETGPLYTILDKAEKAGIDMPASFSGDSTPIDEALEYGTAKGVFKKGEPVIFLVDECSLNK